MISAHSKNLQPLMPVIGGGLGHRFSPRLVLGTSFLLAGAISAVLFNGPEDFPTQATFSFLLGATFSEAIFVNLAGRASGVFVTSLCGSATAAGFITGWIVGVAGWTAARNIQLVLLCFVGAIVLLALRPDQMTTRAL
jgi:DHA1 family inner membrane transport protein